MTTAPVEKGLLYEYTKILTGEYQTFPEARFGKKNPKFESEALKVFRYAFEIFMHWTPEETRDRISVEIIRKLNLERLVKYLAFPPELEIKLDQKKECLATFGKEDLRYIVHLMYPNVVPYEKYDLITSTLRDVIIKKRDRFPKKYFTGKEGMFRACVCLRYVLTHYYCFHSYKEMFEFIGSPEGSKALSKYKLRSAMKDLFTNPLDYLDAAILEGDRQEHPEVAFWFHYYKFLYMYKKEYGVYPNQEPDKL